MSEKFFNKNWKHTFYNSQTLNSSDISQHLSGNAWLNDNIITFYFLFLECEKFKKENFSFICPSTVFMVQMLEDYQDIVEQVSHLDLPKKDIIFIPINDSVDIQTGGGSHWSLMVYFKKSSKYIHFDSAGELNFDAAQRVVMKIAKLIDPKVKEGDEVILETAQSSQQKNGFDCGVFTLANADNIAMNGFLDFKKVDQKFVSQFRQNLVKLIQEKYLQDVQN
jgi:sentrin-specific protease 8